MDIKIALAYHKPSIILNQSKFVPIHVGKELHPEINLGIIGDDSGDSISIENGYYCELTALYWIWKNTNAEVKGLMHYRRIFDVSNSFVNRIVALMAKLYNSLRYNVYLPNNQYNEESFIANANLLNDKLSAIINRYDIIASKKCKFDVNVTRFFSIIGEEYISILRQAVKETNYEYYDTLKSSLTKNKMHYANMVIMKSNLFDDYCKFIFSTLDRVKNILIDEGYLLNLNNEKIFSRKLGYLGELLTNAFICHKKSKGVKIKEMPVAFLK